MQRAQHDDAGLLDFKIDGAGESDRFVKLRRGRSLVRGGAGGGAAQHRLDDERAAGGRACWAQPVGTRVARARLQ